MSKIEKFKCLICGTFFEKTKEEWDRFNEELKNVDDPDKVKSKIMCPNEKCKSVKLQHLIPVRKDYVKDVIVNPSSKVVDFITNILGIITAEAILLTSYEWRTNAASLIESVLGFLGIVLAIKLVNQLLALDILYSSGLVLAIYLLKVISRVKK